MGTPSEKTQAAQQEARPALMTFLVTMLLFFGGGIFGVWLSDQYAPASLLAPMIGLLLLPLGFIIGMNAWLGLALFAAVWSLLRRLVRAQSLRDPAAATEVPPGAFVFVPLVTMLSGLGGVVMAVLATTAGAVATVLIYLGSGFVYGCLCWLAARSGYLPFPAE